MCGVEKRRWGEDRRRGEEGGINSTQLLSGDWLRWSASVGRPRGGYSCGDIRVRGGDLGVVERLVGHACLSWLLPGLLCVDTAESRVRACARALSSPLAALRSRLRSFRFQSPGSSDRFIHISCPLRRVW